MLKSTLSNSISTSVGDCLILRVGEDLSGDYLYQLKTLATENIHKNGFSHVIFDLSELKFIDLVEFNELKVIAKMLRLLGSDSIFSGMHPGIVAHLIANNVDMIGLKATLDLNDALEKFGVTNVR